MAIDRLLLSNFRSYKHLSVSLSGHSFALVGSNGSGKTNFLEALSLFAPGRGLRRASYDQMLHFGGPARATCYIELQRATVGMSKLATVIESDENSLRRRVSIDGNFVPSEELLNYLALSWFVPSMDGMFTGAGADRRRFIDRMVLSLDADHGKRVAEYEKISRSRNKLLKGARVDQLWLDAIEVQLARLAVAICIARLDLVQQLQPFASIMPSLGFPSFALRLQGSVENWLSEELSALEVEDRLITALKANRLRDKVSGRTLLGAHRTELEVFHVGKSCAAHLCSTGEQKILLLGLILSHAYLTKKLTGIAPILLLDEIIAHLDVKHKYSLFAVLSDLGCQFFVTGAELELFSGLEDRLDFLDIAQLRCIL